MHPTLRILVAITEDGHLVIEHGEFDVTISLLLDRVQGADLVFAGIPARVELPSA